MANAIVVMMAGGRGERFWPRSRRGCPKQFLSFDGGPTLLQESVTRIRELTEVERIYVATNVEQAAMVRKQLPFLPVRNVIIEPEGRNTAPCIGLAAAYIHYHYPEEDPVIAFLPSDCRVLDEVKMRKALRAGFEICRNQKTGVIYGMRPTRPETGFGYIQLGNKLGEFASECSEASVGEFTGGFTSEEQGTPYYQVAGFREKPDRETAEKYVATGNYLWNGGISIWQFSGLMAAIQSTLPELYRGLQQFLPSIGKTDEMSRLEAIYSLLPDVSVDYGILEKSAHLIAISSDYGWEDLGSWTALERMLPKDESGNVIQGEWIGIGTDRCIIHSPWKPVATMGVSGLIIVETDDVLLVCAANQAQSIKKLLHKIAAKGHSDLL
jgi:mannose-1-phosphate guanylyltransferase